MHIEIQVALNFLISFLYNKLPRRRVNQFGEELEKTLKIKFEGHWYPEKPFKGSAFRCLKTAPPLEPVFEIAAREAGMDLSDIQENLPKELSIWVDPGEVSYRMGEKLPVKILYSDGDASHDRSGHGASDREVIRTFNPEAQCFKPIDSLSSQLAGLGIQSSTVNGGSSTPTELSSSSPASPGSTSSTSSSPTSCQVFGNASNSSSPNSSPGSVSPTGTGFRGIGQQQTNANGTFLNSKTPALTFTTAAFAQTKFGSTKLKTSSKRSHRMSPTEFSAYIKQRAMLQQQQQQQQQHSAAAAMFVAAAAASSAAVAVSNNQNSRPRSLSPLDNGYLMGNRGSPNSVQHMHQPTSPFSTSVPPPPPPSSVGNGNRSIGVFDHGYLGDLFAAAANNNNKLNQRSGQQQNQQPNQYSTYHMQDKISNEAFSSSMSSNPMSVMPPSPGAGNAAVSPGSGKPYQQNRVDNVGFNLNVATYPNQYQHLLVAN